MFSKVLCTRVINPFPNNEILDETKLKAFAYRVENLLGKEENTGYQHFLLSNNVFKRPVSQRRKKVSLCGNGLKVGIVW